MPLLCKKEYLYVNSNEPEKRFLEKLSNMILETFDGEKTVVFLCIGTDRATGLIYSKMDEKTFMVQ